MAHVYSSRCRPEQAATGSGCAQAQERKGKGKRRASSVNDPLPDPEAEPERWPGGLSGIEVLLDLLGKSLCARSAGHLETALHLIEARMHSEPVLSESCQDMKLRRRGL
jgi:hypothetical protein